jgi:hypothetical protein
MNDFLRTLIFIFIVAKAHAHPGVGIVMNSRGVVYYTDLKNIWQIKKDGKVSVAVSNVHSHELYIDKDDNLFGEHLWYEGEATDKWGHFVWKLSPDGKLEKVIPDTEGFPEYYSFVSDHAGNMFWPDRSKSCQKIVEIDKGGKKEIRSSGCLKNIRWMTATHDGIVFVVDDGVVKRVEHDGAVETMTDDLKERKAGGAMVNDLHLVMGLWTDRSGSVFAAIFGAGRIKKIDRAKNVTVVAETSIGWSPSGGLTSPDGDYWLLEYSPANTARVEYIAKDGRRIIYNTPH